MDKCIGWILRPTRQHGRNPFACSGRKCFIRRADSELFIVLLFYVFYNLPFILLTLLIIRCQYHRKFYYNKATNESTWELPKVMAWRKVSVNKDEVQEE